MEVFAKYWITRWFALLLVLLLPFEPTVYAQYEGAALPPPEFTPMQTRPAFSQPELDQMLAPIALYPDQLLSQILMAATYPLEVVESSRWSRANPYLRGDDAVMAVQQMNWDPSIQSLVAFPQVLQLMNDQFDWTERLGDAFLAQEPQVMGTIQTLRQRAYAAGNLGSNDQIQVVYAGQSILVEPANPAIIYVPYYDPNVVYGSWWWSDFPPVYWTPWPGYYSRPGYSRGFAWDIGISIATGFFFGDFDWHHRRVNVVNVNNYYYNRGGHDERNVPRKGNTATGGWQHDPDHRRGVPYRDESLRQQYGRVSVPRNTRRDYRGYDQSSSNRGEPVSQRNQGSIVTAPPNRPVTNDTADSHANGNRQFVGGKPETHKNERVPQATNRPIVVRRPVTEIRPHALEGIERGAEVQSHSSRGRASVEGSIHSQNSTPESRSSGKAPAKEKQHPK